MRMRPVISVCVAVAVMAAGTPRVWAAKKGSPAAETRLTGKGQELEAKYTRMLRKLRAEIEQALPRVSERKEAVYLKAGEAESAAKEALAAAQRAVDAIGRAQGLVDHAQGKWLGGAEQGIAEAREMLKHATTEAEREAAQNELATWQKDKAEGLKALDERLAVLDRVKREEPRLTRDLEAAKQSLDRAHADVLQALEDLNLVASLSSEKFDARLAKYAVLSEATPRGLAEFAQRGRAQQALIAKLLGDADLMIQMAVADGARGGRYGEAMGIYTAIRKTSRNAANGVLQRLAVAISLEHAKAVGQENAKALVDAPKIVDPVARYLHFEKAYLDGELDPAFTRLSTWDLRMVVDGEEPDEMLAWGREMLRSYRPDHVSNPDYRWRYVGVVRTDVRYGSQYNKYDKPELQIFQNVLMNGGVCGRRAFFGKFILRAFGIPATARPQRGHAALIHWTPDGWVICLGANWGKGWTKTRYIKDLDFLANTQARAAGEAFLQVKRAQWIGAVMGEVPVYGFHSATPGIWYGLALYMQQVLIEETEAEALAAVGEELGEANESAVTYPADAATVTEADREIRVNRNGVITVPAAACSKPTRSTGKILFMRSNLGGKQLHYSSTGQPEAFEYTFEVPEAGPYELTARVACPSWGQILLVVANGAAKPTEIALPLTTGLWGETPLVQVTLVKGTNVLTFSRGGENIRGLSIRDFTLKPL